MTTPTKKQLEVGKEYITRGGEKVKCVYIFPPTVKVDMETARAVVVCLDRSRFYRVGLDGDYLLLSEDSQDILFPKTTRLRPWRLEEVPLGRVVVKGSYSGIILGRNDFGQSLVRVYLADRGIVYAHNLLEDGYTLEDGSPCGVVEEVEE